MINPKDFYENGLALHGHKCPAMPMGLRIGAAAMNKLGVGPAPDGQLIALLEIGEHHCATCFADGVQIITGCTFGKGNIKKLNYGKWGVTLIDRKSSRACRVTPTAEAMMANKKTTFFSEYREKGIPASQVPAEHVEPIIERIMNTPDENLLVMGEVFDYEWQEPVHSFSGFVCDECGEMTAEAYGRVFEGKKVCIPCRNKLTRKE